MTTQEKAQLDRELAPPQLRERTIDEQNAEALRMFAGGKMPGKPVPLKPRRVDVE